MRAIKLVYIGHALLNDSSSPRLWDLIEPKLEGFTAGSHYPTLSLEGLREHGLITKGDKRP